MGSEWGRENGGGGLNFVAEAMEVFLGAEAEHQGDTILLKAGREG